MEIEERAPTATGRAATGVAMRMDESDRAPRDGARLLRACADANGQSEPGAGGGQLMVCLTLSIRPREGAEMMLSAAMGGDAKGFFICAA